MDPIASRPFVSVVVPSLRRPETLLELLGRLVGQRYDPFEIVVVEQSEDPALARRIRALRDPRVVLLERPPLGLAGARNEALRHAKGEILLFIDDDDLPIGDDWIALHAGNFDDPLCLGVTGRICLSPEGDPPPRHPRLVQLACFRYTPFKDPVCLWNGTLRREGTDFVNVCNGSFRRAVFERAGGFDEGLTWGDENTLFFRFDGKARPGEYFAFDPRPAMWRRTAVGGGLHRRVSPTEWDLHALSHRMAYHHAVVGHYFPIRFKMLYPLFVLRAVEQTVEWIWDPDNRDHTRAEKVRASLRILAGLPSALRREWSQPTSARIRRVGKVC